LIANLTNTLADVLLARIVGFSHVLTAHRTNILSKGKLEQSDLAVIMLTETEKDLSIEQFKQFLAILKKYPEERERARKRIRRVAELLERMEEMI